METKTALLTLNERLHTALLGVVSDLTSEQLHTAAPAIDERPIMAVAIHAYSNLLGVLAVVAGRKWSLSDWPLSDWPARLPQPASTTALVALINELHAQAETDLETVSAKTLDQPVTLPWGEQQAGEAIIDILVHGFHHASAIGGMRAIAGFPTPPEE